MSAFHRRWRRQQLAAVCAVAIAVPLTVVAVASAMGTNEYGAGFEVFESASELTAGGVDPSPGSVNLVNGSSNAADDWVAPAGGTGVITASRPSPATATGTESTCSQTVNTGDGILYCDTVKNDKSIFNGGAKESDPAGWSIIPGSVTPNTYIPNTYARGRVA
jgi:hypothetical protein